MYKLYNIESHLDYLNILKSDLGNLISLIYDQIFLLRKNLYK